VPGPASIGIASGDIAIFSSILVLDKCFTVDFFDCSISNPTKKIKIPPVILKAGIVIPNNSKINFPKITNAATIINAVIVDFKAILF
jgi:hypothetical protein